MNIMLICGSIAQKSHTLALMKMIENKFSTLKINSAN